MLSTKDCITFECMCSYRLIHVKKVGFTILKVPVLDRVIESNLMPVFERLEDTNVKRL